MSRVLPPPLPLSLGDMPLRSRTGDTPTRRDNFYHRALIRAIQVHTVGGARHREPVKVINVKTRKTRWRTTERNERTCVRKPDGMLLLPLPACVCLFSLLSYIGQISRRAARWHVQALEIVDIQPWDSKFVSNITIN